MTFLKDLCIKYDFKYPEDKLIELAKAVKDLVDSQAKYPDWSKREDIKSALKSRTDFIIGRTRLSASRKR